MSASADSIAANIGSYAEKISNILTRAERLPVLICIDGRSASGKTALAAALLEYFGAEVCAVFHADDFFLPKERKTPERLAQKGGNLDYERLAALLEDIKSGGRGDILYYKYDCAEGKYLPAQAERRRLVIVEGVYAAGEHLRQFYDAVFIMDVDRQTQLRRLAARESAEMFLRYTHEFLPLEEEYFA